MTKKQKKMLKRIILSLCLFAAINFVKTSVTVLRILYLIVYLIISYDVIKMSFINIKNKEPFDETLLMTIATVGAFLSGEYAEGTAVMLFYQIGELFQSIAVERSRKSISSLMDIRPDYAWLEKDGELIKTDPYEIKKGDIIVVKPGEKIPLDGKVIKGESVINTSALTGESVPQNVSIGSSVISGCVNISGLIHINVEKEFSESTVSKILELVENSSVKKAKAENFITKFARVYTPAVVLCAVVLAIIPPIFLGNFSQWVSRALIFLVVSCPCAIVISVPLTFFGGIGSASKRGILVKGGNYIDAMANVDTIVFDKTGTITEGIFKVNTIKSIDCTEEELIKTAAEAEAFVEHPISKALRDKYGKKIDLNLITDTKNITGMGVEAKINGNIINAGNSKYIKTLGVKPQTTENGSTAVHVCKNKKYMGYILISDSIKPNAEKTIKELKNSGVNHTAMLTGDSAENAVAVAQKVGIDEVHYGLLPKDKVDFTEKYMAKKPVDKKLAFVGDGINDAPVLSMADIGIAMGGLGSDAAIEAADIVIMDDNISKIPEVIKIAKKTINIAKQNIIFAISIKIIVLVLSAFGLSNMWEAVFADVGVSVIAILNACRMIRK